MRRGGKEERGGKGKHFAVMKAYRLHGCYLSGALVWQCVSATDLLPPVCRMPLNMEPVGALGVQTPVRPGRKTPVWAHPSTQAMAAVYIGCPEAPPKLAPSGAMLPVSHREPMDSVAPGRRVANGMRGLSRSGAYEPGAEPPAYTHPGWVPPCGLPSHVPADPLHKMETIQPFLTPICIPTKF